MKTDKKNQTKEEAILQAAEHEFFTRGFDGARTTSIAKSAGVTHAMLHYYFKTKENLFDIIVSKKIEILVNMFLVTVSSSNLSLELRLKEAMESHFNFILKNPELPRFFLNEIYSSPKHFKSIVKILKPKIKKTFKIAQIKLDAETAKKHKEKVDVRHIIMDIVALNVFPFIAYPIIQILFGKEFINMTHFMDQRKKETVETMMCRLQKIL
jgi:TetR/AcrR family transcriptional regulator